MSRGKAAPRPTPTALSVAQVAKRWGCDEESVADFIKTGALPAQLLIVGGQAQIGEYATDRVALNGLYPLDAASASLLLEGRSLEIPRGYNHGPEVEVLASPGTWGTLVLDPARRPNRGDIRVLRVDVEKYEGDVQGTSPSPDPHDRSVHRADFRYRHRCQAIAQLIWEKEPDVRIAQMARRKEIKDIALEGKVDAATQGTIEDWIREVAIKRVPGRPRKS